MKYLDVNGRVFAKDKAALLKWPANNDGRSCLGYYRVIKGGVQLLNKERALMAFIVNNRHREQFFVSAFRLKEDRRARYMYALTSSMEKLLGVDTMTYTEQVDAARRAIKQFESVTAE